jgi:hypothetical protein
MLRESGGMEVPDAAPVRNAVPFNKVAIVSTCELILLDAQRRTISSHRLPGHGADMRIETTS